MPRINLFIPAYNNPEYNKRALWSIASQSYDLVDVILVDDCSSNSLRGIASAFSTYIKRLDSRIRFTYIRNTSKQVAYNVYNSYSLVRTQWAFQFPHDDWFCDKDVIKRWVTYIQRNPELTAVVGHTRLEAA